MRPARFLLPALLAAVVLGALHLSARASGTTCVAWIGGVESTKKTPAELVVFNVGAATLSLDLTLRAADGTVLADRAGEVVVGAFRTLAVDLQEQLTRDLAPKEKPYQGLVSLELRGESPFSPDTALVHVTQYFGKRASPKAAFVLPAAFRDVSGD